MPQMMPSFWLVTFIYSVNLLFSLSLCVESSSVVGMVILKEDYSEESWWGGQ